MRLEPDMTDEAVLAEIGQRLARRRLDRNLTQRELSDRAGVGRRAVQRIELGAPVTTQNLIRVLRALGSLDSLDAGILEPVPSPVQALRLHGHQRQRASGSRSDGQDATDGRPWRWGDDGP